MKNKECTMKKAVVVVSGGMDSVTLLYHTLNKGYECYAISFDYGQRHKRELKMAEATCTKLLVPHKIIDVKSINQLLPGSSLTDKSVDVPKGLYSDNTMKATVVPNRNMVFLSIASAYALSIGARVVALGIHAGDHAIYPDCREEFLNLCNKTVNAGNLWFKPIKFYAPYLHKSKGEIVADGLKLDVDYKLTHTCYVGKNQPCGKCGSCTERIEAFFANNVKDPLYKDVREWAIAVNHVESLKKGGRK